MLTNVDSIEFNYSEEDKKLFKPEQREHWKNIQRHYLDLRKKCLQEITLPQSGTHREWITSRVNYHTSPSLIRLLYLTEGFCNSSKTFNAVSSAVLVKAMVEIPLHLGYITWILSEHNSFEEIKSELHKLAFGNRDPESGLTTSGKVTQKILYTRSDEMVKKIFKKNPSAINIFESLYKDANATGHHNYEARMLTGIQNKDTWKAKDRKESFVFFSNNIFQFFMHCDAVLGMSGLLLKAIDHYLSHLPLNFPGHETT